MYSLKVHGDPNQVTDGYTNTLLLDMSGYCFVDSNHSRLSSKHQSTTKSWAAPHKRRRGKTLKAISVAQRKCRFPGLKMPIRSCLHMSRLPHEVSRIRANAVALTPSCNSLPNLD